MHIEQLGNFTEDELLGWLTRDDMSFPLLGGETGTLILDDYRPEDHQAFVDAVKNFMALTPDCFKLASEHLLAYYKDYEDIYDDLGWSKPLLDTSDDLWNYVTLGNSPLARFREEDKTVYISLSCSCDWEPEHGLMLVFKNGEYINKLGPYDGHVTNSDAFDKDELENVVYR